jgi:hypothetical protein
MINYRISNLSASGLRTLLIVKTREFIRSLDNGISVDQLAEKIDFLKKLLKLLSYKEMTEIKEILGNYFPEPDRGISSNGLGGLFVPNQN